jgi:hypothetical protein
MIVWLSPKPSHSLGRYRQVYEHDNTEKNI